MWPFRKAPPPPPPSITTSSNAVTPQPTPAYAGARMAAAKMATQKPKETPYALPPPVPGVRPKGLGMAMDDAMQISQLYSWANNAYAYVEGQRFLGYPILAELAQRPEFRRMSEIIAKEMTRKWIRLTASADSAKSDKVKELGDELERLEVRERFAEIALHDGLFGKAHLYIDTGASDDPEELATPLVADSSKIKKGSLQGFRVIEPMWTSPTDYNGRDPLAADYYRPINWWVMGRRIHRTRLLTFVGREVPDLLKPAYMFGGLSLTQMSRPYVGNWLRTRQSVSDLVHAFTDRGLKTDLQNLLAQDGQLLIERVNLFNQTKDNRGMMMIGTEEEFFNIVTPLGTLDKLQAQSQEQMASVSGIPLIKLLGVTPAGLNATAEPELQAFYDNMHSGQEHTFRPNLRTVIDVVQVNLWGAVDPDIKFIFEPLWEMDESARAALEKTEADTAAVYIESGVLSPEDVRTVLSKEEEGRWNGLDPTDLPELPEEQNDEDDGGGDPEDVQKIAGVSLKGGEQDAGSASKADA